MAHYFTNEENLKSEFRTIKYNYGDFSLSFFSDNGVFSKNHLDYGSKLLVETMVQNCKIKQNILDVGCGYGFIGISLAKILNSKVTLIDINKRAIHLTEKNCRQNGVDAKVIVSDLYENVEGKFDSIVSNPPIRAGKKVVLEILLKAKEFLNKEGQLWFVIRKDQGAKSIALELKKDYEIEVIKKSKGFSIFRAKVIDIHNSY